MFRYNKRRGIALLLLVGALSSCGITEAEQQPETSQPPAQETIQPVTPEPLPEQQPEIVEPELPEVSPQLESVDASTAGHAPETEEEPLETMGYSFTGPAPETEPVDNTYFQDAAFIGDSRTDGFLLYSGIGCGENLTSNGLSIFSLTEKKVFRIGGEKYTLREALERKQYGKVYLSLGVNELGYYDDEGFYQGYLAAIDLIRETQPNAVIYIQGLIPVNEDLTTADFLENDHLRVYNSLMHKAAQEKQVVFLDLYTEFADENGSLPLDASKDGVHLHKPYCQRWLDYLQRHTVPSDVFFGEKNEEMMQ